MFETEMMRPPAPTPPITALGSDGESAMETWLRLSLAARFDPILAEPLPPDILAALSKLH